MTVAAEGRKKLSLEEKKQLKLDRIQNERKQLQELERKIKNRRKRIATLVALEPISQCGIFEEIYRKEKDKDFIEKLQNIFKKALEDNKEMFEDWGKIEEKNISKDKIEIVDKSNEEVDIETEE